MSYLINAVVMNIFQQNKTAYNYLAEKYDREWSEKPDMELVNKFMDCLPEHAKILDVGCGPGHYSKLFSSNGHSVIGIDSSEKMLLVAKRRNPNLAFRLLDMNELDYEPNSFDAIWVCSSFPHIHISDASSVLCNFRVILNKDGLLFINAIIGDKESRVETAEEIGGGFAYQGRFFQWYPSSHSFIALLENSGFSANEISRKYLTSHVLINAHHRTNFWCNYICKIKSSR